MLLWYIRCFFGLSFPQHLVILVTTFAIPLSFEVYQGWQSTGFCLACIKIGKLVLYFIWYQIAMLVISSMTKHEKNKADQRVDQLFSELGNRIDRVDSESQRGLVGIEEGLTDLREWVRQVRRHLSRELGVNLPSLGVALRGDVVGGQGSSVRVVFCAVPGGSFKTRLLFWIRRRVRIIRRWVLKLFWDWEDF